ncbi:glycoside hydrolase, partial [Mycena pura]
TNIAEAGTLTLEWFTLTQFTNNATYADLTAKSAIHIANLSSPLPGFCYTPNFSWMNQLTHPSFLSLAAQLIDPASGAFQDATVTWGGGSDSFFEHLLKYARLSNTNNTIFINTWKTAVDSSIKTLLKTSTVGNHVYLADLDDQGRIRHVGSRVHTSHLACFHAGNWYVVVLSQHASTANGVVGGKLLEDQTIVDIALQLNDGCWNTYASTETGIGPESFAFISADGNFTGSPLTAQQLAYYESHGFYTTDSAYVQRPEVLESNFYAWRITGDTKCLDRAATAIAKFATFLPGKVGFAGLNDVDSAAAGHIDATESFWFAETKYLYLTFDDPGHISLDDYALPSSLMRIPRFLCFSDVFNTECHPLKAPLHATRTPLRTKKSTYPINDEYPLNK